MIDARDAIHLGYAAEGARDIEAIRARVSPEILRVCMSRGETVATPCALEDECFRDLESVRQHQRRGILFVPIALLVGAIYLQGAGAFSQPDHLGSTVVLTDEFAAVHQSIEYFVDGETWLERAPMPRR